MPIRKPALIVEGAGDAAAIPLLVRRVTHAENVFDFCSAPRPIQVGDPSTLSQSDKLERYVRYACSNPDADSVLMALDFDVFDQQCPVTIAKQWSGRIGVIPGLQKPVAVCFFVREYETLILSSISDVMANYPNLNWHPSAAQDVPNAETIRGAKEEVSKRIVGGCYRASVDQVKFTSALDLQKLHHVRCFARFKSSISWLRGWVPGDALCTPV